MAKKDKGGIEVLKPFSGPQTEEQFDAEAVLWQGQNHPGNKTVHRDKKKKKDESTAKFKKGGMVKGHCREYGK